MRLSYQPEYVARALDDAGWPDGQVVGGLYALGVNLPVRFDATYEYGVVAAVLRDIIPQGYGRRRMLEVLGYCRDPGPRADLPLLLQGSVAPVGHLRVKPAADAFAAALEPARAPRYTREDVARLGERMIDEGLRAGVPVAAALGAGGEAPKVLLVEDGNGRYALEGTVPEAEVHGRWLVKMPRGRKSADDVAVLQGEAAVHQALEGLGLNTVSGSVLVEKDSTLSLWLPRFDRDGGHHHGVESVYSAMGMLGDGAALDHLDVVERLADVTWGDAALVDYLTLDIVNTMVGNSDNHGRNVAIVTTDIGVHLAPYYDLAPMVLDPEGVSWATRWRGDAVWQGGTPDYARLLTLYAGDRCWAVRRFVAAVGALDGLERRLADRGAPARMLRHPGVRLDAAARVGEVLARMR
ncbi:HipA domain-containing protein [Aquisalimonas sp. APHAB1-3]|uniref:HipA domain-containing protein n=1 Tax=Aquisalimonas sp. APHAB1-3 TaxID=3402080 RepID=UPI003AAAF82F